MKKIFIAYADEKMAYSLKRIGRQARRLGIFDDVLLWKPQDLPDYIKQSPLMQYSYGGGYWAWKPCIIYETLQRYEEGTIVCYIDAGCTLKKGIEWGLYWELLNEYSALCFKYTKKMPEWKKFGTSSTKIEHWAKKELLLFLDEWVGTSDYRKCCKVWGGGVFFKGKDNALLKDWLNIVLKYPEVILDPSKDEMKDQYPFFAQHKHDQPVLTALAYKFENCCVLPELSETWGNNVAICATRIRAHNAKDYYWYKIKSCCRNILGECATKKIKKIIGKIA